MSLKVQFLNLNMNLICPQQRVSGPSYPFHEKFGDQVKGRSPKDLQQWIVIPHVAHLKIKVLSCNMNLISSPQQAPRPSYPFGGKFGRSGKGSFTEKAKIVVRISMCSTPERTGYELQYEPFLCSVACSWTELSIGGNLWRSGKGSFAENAQILGRGSLRSAL